MDIWGSDHAAWHFQYSASAFSKYCDRVVYGADDSYVYLLENKGKQQDKVPSGGKILIAALLGSCMVYYVGAFFAPLFPRHMLYEYKSDIKKLKEEYREAYFFFPDAIPEEAMEVTWVVCPSMMQGSGYEFLGFKASEEYINSIVAKYKEEAHVRNRSEESYDKRYLTIIWVNSLRQQ